MATKVNLMKLLQEARGLAQITNRRPSARVVGPVVLPVRPIGGRMARPKRTVRIIMHDPPDIPHPVKIIHLRSKPLPAAAAAAL